MINKVMFTSNTARQTEKTLNNNFDELESRTETLEAKTHTSDFTNDGSGTEFEVVAGYTEFTTTSDYVGYYVLVSDTYTKVTSSNKDSLSITAGTTKAYQFSPYATREYVGENGGKINSISVNGTAQTIDANKNVDISVPTSDSDLTNDRYVRYDTSSQGLNDTQKGNARANIGAGTSSFSGSYDDLSNKPTLGTAAALDTGTSQGNIPVLGSNGKLPSSMVPASAITDTFVVNSEAAMLALSSAEVGDVAVRTDINKSFILKADPYSTLANWQELLTPTDAVSSVNGQTGVVVLGAADVGAEPTISTKNSAFNKSFEDTDANILMDGTADAGISDKVARADHIHPHDTSKQDALTAGAHITISTISNVLTITGEEGITTVENNTFIVNNYGTGVYRWKTSSGSATFRFGTQDLSLTGAFEAIVVIGEDNNGAREWTLIGANSSNIYLGKNGTGSTPIGYVYTYDIGKLLQKTDVVDNLTTQTTDAPLSAKQGYQLNQNKQDKYSTLSFTASDAGWSSADSDGFYTLTITSAKKPIICFDTNGEQIMAGLKSDGTNIYVIADAKFAGSVLAF